MQRAIITGATGAIGTALIENLISHNIEVLVITHYNSKRNALIPVHSLVTVKYASLENLKDLQNDTGKEYDVFYHFAWVGTSGKDRNDLYLQYKNISYTLDAVKIASRFGCRVFIGAGSQAEYGRVEGILKPSTPVFPDNGYGIAKLCAGHMSKEYAHQLGLQHIWVRILSVYGPNDGENTMVSSTIRKLKNREVAQFTKGEQLWDYLYSKDAADAFRLLGDNGIDGKTYVLGSGVAQPLRDYIYVIGQCLNALDFLDIGAIPYNERQVMHLCADISQITLDTGWSPTTQFKEGIINIIK